MSLNQLVRVDSKPWLNVRGYNVNIDGNLSMQDGTRGYALCYHGVDDVRFSPINNIQSIGYDMFYIIPVQDTAGGTLDFTASPFAADNFTINGSNNLVCQTAGKYLVAYKVVEASGTTSSRPNPYFAVNALPYDPSSMRIPLCTTSSSNIPSFAGNQNTTILALSVSDVLTLELAVQPNTGTISLQNSVGASNVVLLYLGA